MPQGNQPPRTTAAEVPRRAWTTRRGAALCWVLIVVASVATSVSVASAGTIASTAAPTCAWQERVSADTRNVFLPDSAATYWVQRFEVRRDLRITLSGQYPDARYASFNVYDGSRGSFSSNGVSSAIADHRIAADPGSVNPWQQSAAPGGRFTVTLRMDVSPSQGNTLPLAPADAAEGGTGYLIYRVYLPAGGDPSTVVLPTVTLHQGGASQTLPQCDAAGRDSGGDQAGTTESRLPDAGQTGFARPAETNSVFPNADNAYLAAWVDPPGVGEVVVVRARAPQAATGTHPTPWPVPGADLRYWSMCTNLRHPLLPVVVNRLPSGEVDYGCRHDDVTRLDSSGQYTYVIGTESQRAAIERVPTVTFLPFSTAQPNAPHLVLLRNMLAVPGFAQAVQNVPQDGRPESAAAVMGPYYPRVATCSLRTLTADGPAGCPTG